MRAVVVQDDHSVTVEEVDRTRATGKRIVLKVAAVGLNPGDA